MSDNSRVSVLENIALFIVFLTLLFVISELAHAGGNVKHLYIFGDSLSSPTGCEWSKVFQGDWAVHNYAQAGLTARDYDWPDHLKVRQPSVGFVGIGTNDVGSGGSAWRTALRIKILVMQMKDSGMKDIIVMGIPLETLRHHPVYREFRKLNDMLHSFVMQQDGVHWYEPIWDDGDTSDGLHPTCGANMFIGLSILQEVYNVSE